MPYFKYILKSTIVERFYIGSTLNLENRLIHHNSGHSRSTKACIPWEIVYFEEYETKSEAIRREYALKRIRNTETLLKIIKNEI